MKFQKLLGIANPTKLFAKYPKLYILAYILIPMIAGGLFGIPPRGWVNIRHFFTENQQWAIAAVVWLGMMGVICLFAEATNQKVAKAKRIFGCIVITIWIWGWAIFNLFLPQQLPPVQQHIDPPHYWWKGAPPS